MNNNNSDDDQGFVPTKVQIKSDNKIRQKNKHDPRYDRPIDFQSRYIYGDGIMRKQPSQVYTRFRKYLGEQETYNNINNIQQKNKNENENKNQRKNNKKVDNKKQQQCINQVQLNKLIKHQKHNQSNLTPNTKYLQQNNQQQFQQQQQDDLRHSMPSNIYTVSQKITNNINTITSQVSNNNTNNKQVNTINSINTNNQQQIIKKQISGHPYIKYIKNQNYTLVYSRYKDKIQNITLQNDDFACNQINLSKVLAKYDGDHYSVLKGFQYYGKFDGIQKKKKTQINQYNKINKLQKQKYQNKQDINQNHNNNNNINNNNNNNNNNTIIFPQLSTNTHTHQRLHSHTYQSSSLNHNNSTNSTNNYHYPSHPTHLTHPTHPTHLTHGQQHSYSFHKNNQFINMNNNPTSFSSLQLQFDSRFQCGNLMYVFKHKLIQNYYVLFLQNDTNSYGYNQWFYYSLKNIKSNTKYKFYIVNLRKKHSLFKQGMKISVFSLIQAQNNNGNGWKKCGNNIKYQRSNIKKLKDKKYKFYSLYFQLEFQHNDDYIEIAMNIPYSYSRLIHHLKICQNLAKNNNIKQEKQKIIESPYQSKRRQLIKSRQNIKEQKKQIFIWQTNIVGYSIANNAVPYLTIGIRDQKQIQQQKQRQRQKERLRIKQKQLLQKQQKQIVQQQKNKELQSTQIKLNIQQNNIQQQQISNNNNNTQISQASQNISSQVPSSTQPILPTIFNNPAQKTKKVIIIMARQHPGQTWSSFMLQQFLYNLVQYKNNTTNSNSNSNNNNKQHIKWLLQNYTFKIFPMINVDGVIYGNFRCDLGGFDLNRNWRNPDKYLHPQIYSIKKQIQKISNQFIIQCVLDLHGHSKQYNTFSYSCKNDNISSRILSLLISQINPIFYFPFCTFGLSKYKQTTARAALYKLTGNQNILTIQNSFYGAKINQKLIVYDPQVIGELTNSILKGIYYFYSKNQLKTKAEQKIKKNIQQYLSYQKQQITAVDSGSDSDPFLDQTPIKQKIKKILPKSFKSIQHQLQQQQNNMKKKQIIAKKVIPIQKKANKTNINYKTLNPNASTNTSPNKKVKSKQIQQQQQNNIKKQAFIQRTSLSHYKKNSKQLQRKQIDQLNSQDSQRNQSFGAIQDSAIRTGIIGKLGQVALPFYIREKPTLVPIKLKNDSLEIFKDAYDATRNKNIDQQQQISFRRTMAKNSSKKVKILNTTQHQKNQQFPILCVLSQEKKRQNQMQKTHAFYHQKLQQKLTATSMPHKIKPYVQNQKLQYIKNNNNNKSKTNNSSHQQQIIQHQKQVQQQKQKTKQKNKETATLISKIWRQNFARYGKDLNVFFGGMKN